MQTLLTAEQVESYQRDGVVCLRGLFDQAWVERLRAAAEAGLAAPTDLSAELAAQIAAEAMRATRINIVFDQWLIKEPGTPTRTPWHHDLPYWPVDGGQICTLWLALDPVTAESGAVEYVKSSHLWGQRYLPASFSGTPQYTEPLPPVPDIDAMREKLDLAQFELEPGDCTLHHALLLHGAPGNQRLDRPRRAYVTRWAGDDAVYYPRPGIQEMPELPDIPAGGPLASDLWPRVWST